MAPLTSVILSSVFVYLTHAHKHGVQVVSLVSFAVFVFDWYITKLKVHYLFIFVYVCKYIQIGELKKGLNPISIKELSFGSEYLFTAIKTGTVTGVIALAVSSLSCTLASLFSFYLNPFPFFSQNMFE